MILPERSFLGCPVVADLSRLDADVAVLGIPHGVSYVVDDEQRGLATAPAGDAPDYLAAQRAQQRMQSAALPDPVVSLRPAPERSGWFGRLVRVLLAVLVSASTAGYWRRAAGPRPWLTRARLWSRSAPPPARAPPCLQPA